MIDLDDLFFEVFDSDWALKDHLDHELRAIVADYRSALAEDYAKKLAADPPIFRKETPLSLRSWGGFISLGMCAGIFIGALRALLDPKRSA